MKSAKILAFIVNLIIVGILAFSIAAITDSRTISIILTVVITHFITGPFVNRLFNIHLQEID